MPNSRSLFITCGLAVVLAAGLWLWGGRGGPSQTTPDDVEARPGVADARRGPGPRRSHDDRDDDPPPKLKEWREGQEGPPVVEDPQAVLERTNATIMAFHNWHANTNVQLMRCIPPLGGVGQSNALEVQFSPVPEQDGIPVHRMMVSDVRPGLGHDGQDVVVPPQVRTCLDNLVGDQIELPSGAPELTRGHQEIIHAMWDGSAEGSM